MPIQPYFQQPGIEWPSLSIDMLRRADSLLLIYAYMLWILEPAHILHESRQQERVGRPSER